MNYVDCFLLMYLQDVQDQGNTMLYITFENTGEYLHCLHQVTMITFRNLEEWRPVEIE